MSRLISFVTLLFMCIPSFDLPSYASTHVKYVNWNLGVDTGDCTNPSSPCKSIQYAINNSDATQLTTIKVARGTYKYQNNVFDPCQFFLQSPTVVCIINKSLVIIGGYSDNNWISPDPLSNPTIIDGEWQYRGVRVWDSEPQNPPQAGVVMEGFTIRRGIAVGRPQGPDLETFAFGGGMLVDEANLVLRNMRFENNAAYGGGQNNPHYGGAAAGAALAIRKAPNRVVLDRLLFKENYARGGDGVVRGGPAMGAGLFTSRTSVDAYNLEFYDNAADAGNSSGYGIYSGERADAFGALTIIGYADSNFQNIIAQGNRARGGNANNAGGAFGGAIMVEGVPGVDLDNDGQLESATVRITNCRLNNNWTEGGIGQHGGYAAGGAISTIHATIEIDRCKIYYNKAVGGSGSQNQGPVGGGGLHFHNIYYANPSVVLKNSLIVYNQIDSGQGSTIGGGGGGIWLQGIRATLLHNTIANNCILNSRQFFGPAITILSEGVQSGSQPAFINFNIIANHSVSCSPISGAVFIHQNTVANLDRNVFFGNHQDIRLFSSTSVLNGYHTSLFGDPMFANHAVPTYGFRITAGSIAVNQAFGSTESTDLEAKSRLGIPDIGAYEFHYSLFVPSIRR